MKAGDDCNMDSASNKRQDLLKSQTSSLQQQ